MITVEDIMTRHPRTLAATDSLADARRLMAEIDIRHIPVLSVAGGVVGLVTHRDVLEASSSALDQTADERTVHDSHISLADVMTRKLDLVAPEAGLREAAMLMRNHRHGCLPVLDDDELVGIITDTDFVEVSIHLLEQIEAAEPIADADIPENHDLYENDDGLDEIDMPEVGGEE